MSLSLLYTVVNRLSILEKLYWHVRVFFLKSLILLVNKICPLCWNLGNVTYGETARHVDPALALWRHFVV